MASTIKVDQIQLSDGSTPTAADLGLDDSGSVLQVLYDELTTQVAFSNSDTASTDSGLDITVTPKRSNSKFLISGAVHLGQSYTNYSLNWRVVRSIDGGAWTDINVGSNTALDETGFGIADTGIETNVGGIYNITGSIMDAPTYTSTVRYKITVRTYSSYTGYINRNYRNSHSSFDQSPVSTMIVTEIAQ